MSTPLYFGSDFGTGEPNIVDLNQDYDVEHDSTLLRDASGVNWDARLQRRTLSMPDHLEMSFETELFLTMIHGSHLFKA